MSFTNATGSEMLYNQLWNTVYSHKGITAYPLTMFNKSFIVFALRVFPNVNTFVKYVAESLWKNIVTHFRSLKNNAINLIFIFTAG